MSLLDLFRRKAASLPAPDLDRGPAAIVSPQGRATWNLSQLGVPSPFYRVPPTQNLLLYEQLVELVPLVNAAIAKLVQLVGCPVIEAEDDVQADIEEWLARLRVNRLQSGFANGFGTWLTAMLTYGRSHAEILLPAGRDDVYALQQLHTRSIELRPRADGYSLDVVQMQPLAGLPVTLNPRLMIHALYDVRNDNPLGNSLLYGLPFMLELYTTMARGLKATWERFGTPSFHVRYVPPEALSDPTGAQNRAYVSQIGAAFEQWAKSRAKGEVRDFTTAGDIEIKVIGAEGEALDFSTPARSVAEQIVAKTGLPPHTLGLQWATTERLSSVQAQLLTETIDEIRRGVTGELQYLIALRQQLSGGSEEFAIGWPPVSLIDEMDTARAKLFDAQARQQQIANLLTEWKMGVREPEEVARELKPELVGKSDEEVRALLPNLAQEPPAPPPLLQMPHGPPAALPEPAAVPAASGNGRGP